MEIVVLEHEADAPAGFLGDWARERRHRVRTVAVAAGEPIPRLTHGQALVSLGSERSVHSSRERWIAAELDHLRRAHEARVPILGICFGAQALAAALGGRVFRAPATSIALEPVEVLDPRITLAGPWLRWHEDVFALPPGARIGARAGETPLAFASARSVGLQFHPEAGLEIARSWIRTERQQARAGAGGERLSELEAQLVQDADQASSRAFELFDLIARHWNER